MTDRKPRIDGFVPRQRSVSDSDSAYGLSRQGDDSAGLQRLETVEKSHDSTIVSASHDLRSDIDSSLREIDDEQSSEKKQRKHRVNKKKLFKRLILLVLLIALAAGGYVGVKALIATGSIFKGNLFGLIQTKPLKKDANGRSNILIFGTSGSVDDQSHDGAKLTDSLIVLSVDQEKKDAYMVSIPRDLWVKYGQACTSGYQGKINALFQCYENEDAGARALAAKVGEVTGLDIQYNVHVNWAVLISTVDAVGGVDVKVESNPKGVGVLDRNFDWVCNYQCYYVKYDDGEIAHLDGQHALALARARNDAEGYGLAGGNFDREKNQQKILKALREKALSAGTLTDIVKVTKLIDAMGANIKTTFIPDEFQTLMGLGRDIPSDKIVSIALNKEGEAVVTTATIDNQSSVRAIDGLYDYSGIASYIKKQMSSDPATKEGAVVGVFNGSNTAGLAQKAAEKLRAQGLTTADPENVPVAGQYDAYEIYDLTNSAMPATKAKLESLYGVKTRSGQPPFTTTGVDFIVILGQAPSTPQQ